MAVTMNTNTHEASSAENLTQAVETLSETPVLPGMADVETSLSQVFNLPKEVMEKLLAH